MLYENKGWFICKLTSACQNIIGSLLGTWDKQKNDTWKIERTKVRKQVERTCYVSTPWVSSQMGGRKEGGGHCCPRFGGATVWGEIDGCKQQITVLQCKGRFKKRQRLQGEPDPTHLGLWCTATSDSNTLQLAAEAITGLRRVNISQPD